MISDLHLRRAVEVLRQGGLIAYPTEGVWGLGCDPDNAKAVRGLLALKGRAPEKGLILVAASMAQLSPWLPELSAQQWQSLGGSWPGSHTWLVPVSARVPPWISGSHSTVALRVSAHPVVRALCERFGGPIVSTSANPAGKTAARQLLEVQLRFTASPLNRVTLMSGALGNSSRPSTIQDLQTGKIIRP